MPSNRWNRSTIAVLVSTFGHNTASLVLVTALGKQMFDLTRSELDLGFLGLAEFAPAALLVLFTGSVADRFLRTRVAALSAVAEMAATIGLYLYIRSSPQAVVPIFALVIAYGVGRAFYAPASRSIPADIVDAKTLPWLTARRAATWQMSMVVGPVIGGMLYAVHPAAPYLAAIPMQALAAGAMLLVQTPVRGTRADRLAAEQGIQAAAESGVYHHTVQPPPGRTLRDAIEGLRFVTRTPLLFAAISLDLFAVLFGGAVALLPAIADERLGVGAVGFGWLRAAGGIGAALVTIWLMRRPIVSNVGNWLFGAVTLFGVVTVVLGLTRSYWLAFMSVLVLSGADAISVFIRSTLVPLATPPDKRGRVLAVESVFIGASNELGAFESGVAGHFLGAAGAVTLGGIATIVVAGAHWAGFKELRNVDEFPEAATSG